MRDELAETQLALQVARSQVTATGSTLRSAKDSIRAAEGKAREVRGDSGDGDPGTAPSVGHTRRAKPPMGMV